jgi:hypothetical protein
MEETMPRLDFQPDFEFSMVRVAWVALFALLLYWGGSLRTEEARTFVEPVAAVEGVSR